MLASLVAILFIENCKITVASSSCAPREFKAPPHEPNRKLCLIVIRTRPLYPRSYWIPRTESRQAASELPDLDQTLSHCPFSHERRNELRSPGIILPSFRPPLNGKLPRARKPVTFQANGNICLACPSVRTNDLARGGAS